MRETPKRNVARLSCVVNADKHVVVRGYPGHFPGFFIMRILILSGSPGYLKSSKFLPLFYTIIKPEKGTAAPTSLRTGAANVPPPSFPLYYIYIYIYMWVGLASVGDDAVKHASHYVS